MTKQMKWILKSQEWYFVDALPYATTKNIELPFGQPLVEGKKLRAWYRKAKKWHDDLRTESAAQALVTEIPPPPEPPPPPGE